MYEFMKKIKTSIYKNNVSRDILVMKIKLMTCINIKQAFKLIYVNITHCNPTFNLNIWNKTNLEIVDK